MRYRILWGWKERKDKEYRTFCDEHEIFTSKKECLEKAAYESQWMGKGAIYDELYFRIDEIK